jgi:type IV pilus assembly protein PilX
MSTDLMNSSYTYRYGCYSFLDIAMAGMKKKAFQRQRGVSLFIVLIILLLSLIVVLGGLAVANLNESIVGNQSDAQRAYGAAEGLLDAAQRDIRLNGRFCNAAGIGQDGENPTFIAGQAFKCTLRYPSDGDWSDDYAAIVGSVGGQNNCGTGKYIGICISGNPTNKNFQTLVIATDDGTQTWLNGADYTNPYLNILDSDTNGIDYSSAAAAGSGATAVGLAMGTGQASRGKYWVEIFPYNINTTALSGVQNVPIPDGTYPFIFRITAMARGLKSGTVSVLRAYYVPYPATNK